MTKIQLLKNLSVPEGRIDVVIDTDTYNEVDDQFALAYLLFSEDKLTLRAIYAAPFSLPGITPKEGMELSRDEIFRVLKLSGREDLTEWVYSGSEEYLPDAYTPVDSDAARDLICRAKQYTQENPLYVLAIGAITNVASALLLEPSIAENIVIVWLGGHGHEYENTAEFNMMQDIPAARMVFESAAPLVQLPCGGVVEMFAISYQEMKARLQGQNALCDFLCGRVCDALENETGSRVLWDVAAVAWLLNDGERFMKQRILSTPLPGLDNRYEFEEAGKDIAYIYEVIPQSLREDLFKKLLNRRE